MKRDFIKLFGYRDLSDDTYFHIPFRRDIQVLRGIVVLAVILFHANAKYFPYGYLGVDVFFIISGFVVTPLILELFTAPFNEAESWAKRIKYFYLKRFYRLAPALIITILLSIALLFFLAPIDIHQRVSRQGIATLFLLGNLGAYFYAGNYFQPGPNPLIHTWSLSIEAQIYLVLPILFMIILSREKNVKRISILTLTLISVLSFTIFIFPNLSQILYSLLGIKFPTLFSFYSLLERLWQFTLGGLLYYYNQQFFLIKRFKNLASMLAILFLILCLFSPFGGNLKMSSVIAAFAAVFVISLRSLDILPHILKLVLQWVGDRSYSLYLIHMPLIYLINYAPLFESSSKGIKNLQLLGAFVLIFLVGNAMYSLIENPFRSYYKNVELQKINLRLNITLIFLTTLVLLAGWDKFTSFKIFVDPNVPIKSKVVPWAWDSNCVFFHDKFSTESHPCLYPAVNGQGSYLLIGDSHAASFSQTLVTLANNQNMDMYVYTYSGCPFVLDKVGLSPNLTYPFFSEDCFKHNNNILKFLNTVKVDTVIYTQRSSILYVSSLQESNRESLNFKIKSDLLKLSSLTTNILFLGLTPEYRPINSVLEFLFLGEGYYLEIPAFENSFWKNVLVSTKIKYLEIYPLFCRESVDCRNKMGGNWLFYDNDHLSRNGGEFLKPVVQKAISLYEKG